MFGRSQPRIYRQTTRGVTSLSGFGRPFGLTADSEGRIHVADMDLHCVFRFDANLEAFQWLDDPVGWSAPYKVLEGLVKPHKPKKPLSFNGPHSIAVTADGRMFVTTYYDPGVFVLSSEGKLLEVWGREKGKGPILVGPATGTLTAEGVLWVAEYGLNALFAYDTNDMTFIGVLGGGESGFQTSEGFRAGHEPFAFDRPHMAKCDPDGNLIVVDTWNHRLQKFSPNGVFLGSLSGAGKGWRLTANCINASNEFGCFSAPVAISFDNNANMVVTDWGNSRLQWFDADGKFSSVDKKPQLTKPYDAQIIDKDIVIANSSKGEVYIKSIVEYG